MSHRWRVKMKRLGLVGVCHLLWDRHEGESGVNVGSLLSAVSQSVIQAKWDCRYEEGRNYGDDMMRDPGVMLSHYHHLHSAKELSLKGCICADLCVDFSLGTLDLSHATLPHWNPAHDPHKKRGMPTSCYPQACQPSLKGEGPHNLLFVPLLLRKYFLNSSLSFVYFYCSYFLPWFNPVLSYLFAF